MVAAGAVWLGALAGPHCPIQLSAVVLCGGAAVAYLRRRMWLLLVALVGIGLLSGGMAMARVAGTLGAWVPQGRGVIEGTAATDAAPYGDDVAFICRPSGWQPAGVASATPWAGPALQVIVAAEDIAAGDVAAGDRIRVSGFLRSRPDFVRGDPIAGRVAATAVESMSEAPALVVDAGNAIRRRVQNRLAILGGTPEASLLAGFLIGDIADLPPIDNESLRRAGLTHYVAVSGSNVALVLGAWWLVIGVTRVGVRVRSVTGLAVLAVFVVVTRWESSVIRAATMAGLVMGGRAVGVSVDAWTALGGAVALLLAVSGGLAYDVGFQLSAVATAGVLMGMHFWSGRAPQVFWGVLAATVSAQLAVVPLLLVHFGTVPLLSPIANLVAAPLVTGATALAGIGVTVGWDQPLLVAELLAGFVLAVARMAAGWPQLGVGAVAATALVVAATWRTRVRWTAVAVVFLAVAVGMLPSRPPPVPTIIWLDVGQGDSVLLRDPSGAVALVDGGREPMVLREALRRYGIGRIDLLVATHGDADHIGGLTDLFDVADVGRVWVPEYVEPRELLADVVAEAERRRIGVDRVAAGDRAVLGEFAIDVVGPSRRFAEENNGSVVLLVSVGQKSALLPGDVGAIAQRALPELQPDVLMVPHHGAATSDVEWITATVGTVAIISVGPNSYGHPAPEIVAALADSGAKVMTTWEMGDIAVPFR